MLTPWRNPLPCSEYMMQKVVIYFYNSRWIPIMFYSFGDAIALHHTAWLTGQELYIFPPGIDPNHFNRQDVLPLIPSKVCRSNSIWPQPQQLETTYHQKVAN